MDIVPIMFSKACESKLIPLLDNSKADPSFLPTRPTYISSSLLNLTRITFHPTVFISELTCRAWLIAETNKRRTLQKADVANAIAASDMFDFLIDIIPRDDGSGSASGSGAAGTGQTGTGAGVGAAPGAGGVEVVDEEEVDEDDDERVFTEFVRQEEIG